MSNIQNIVISREAGEDLTTGDIVYINSDDEAVKVSSAEATNAFGIVIETTDEEYQVPILVFGVYNEAHLLVEDTDSGAGYDDPISIGDWLVISGKASGTYTAGQAFSSVGGTGVSTADKTTIVAKAMEAVAGVDTGDTYTTGKVFVNFL